MQSTKVLNKTAGGGRGALNSSTKMRKFQQLYPFEQLMIDLEKTPGKSLTDIGFSYPMASGDPSNLGYLANSMTPQQLQAFFMSPSFHAYFPTAPIMFPSTNSTDDYSLINSSTIRNTLLEQSQKKGRTVPTHHITLPSSNLANIRPRGKRTKKKTNHSA